MAQIKVKGTQLDIQDVASEISNDSTAIGSIATGVTTDPGSKATLDNEYLRRDGTNQVTADLDLGTFNLSTTGAISAGSVMGRNVANDGNLLDFHTSDTTIHFTEASISHLNIQDVGTNTHAQIDTHIADVTLHRTINDTGNANTDLWSASKIISELALKSDATHTHAFNDLSDISLTTPSNNQGIIFNGTNWVNTDIILNGSNVSVGGVSVFSAKNADLLEFNGIAAGTGGEISVSLDAVNNNVVIDANPVTIAGGFVVGDISNVTLTSPTNGDYLRFNGTDWINSVFTSDVQTSLGTLSIGDLGDVDLTTTPPNNNDVLLWDSVTSTWVPSVLPSGVTEFINLNDTPTVYTGAGDNFVVVNSSETALDFLPAGLNNLFDVVLTTPALDEALVFDGTTWINQPVVNSFNGRTGNVLPTAGDYSAADVDFVPTGSPGISALNVQQAIEEVYAEKADVLHTHVVSEITDFSAGVTTELNANSINELSDVDTLTTTPVVDDALVFDGTNWVPSAIVNSFNGRTGVVSPATGDYSAADITNVPAGNIAATDVQTAINELDTEKAPVASPTFTGVVGLPIYTIATLPTVVEGALIYVSDATTVPGSPAPTGVMCFGRGGGSPAWIDVLTGLPVV